MWKLKVTFAGALITSHGVLAAAHAEKPLCCFAYLVVVVVESVELWLILREQQPDKSENEQRHYARGSRMKLTGRVNLGRSDFITGLPDAPLATDATDEKRKQETATNVTWRTRGD